MDQIIPRVLEFDRFALDLSRGSLRTGTSDVPLPPKPFEVLRHLAENAGRLVSKQELFEAVWPDVAVTDDSLVQCIRELRDKLGDDGHHLIKTVSRRGYRLDAKVVNRVTVGLAEATESGTAVASTPAIRRLVWAAVGFAACIVLGGATWLALPWLSAPPANALFSEADGRRLEMIAAEKELPLPPFRIAPIDRDLPAAMRRFVGVWVSKEGFVGSRRQFMVIVTDVDRSGSVTGFTVRGPRQPLSFNPQPAGSNPIRARITGDMFEYGGPGREVRVAIVAKNRLKFTEVIPPDREVEVMLEPFWTLTEAERPVSATQLIGR